jgi:hypothetical protein
MKKSTRHRFIKELTDAEGELLTKQCLQYFSATSQIQKK